MKCPSCGEYVDGLIGHKLGCDYVEYYQKNFEDSDVDMGGESDYLRSSDDFHELDFSDHECGYCPDDSGWDSFGSDSDNIQED